MSEPVRAPQPRLVLFTGLPGTGKSIVADDAADLLDAPVLAYDWVMSGLRPFSAIGAALDATDPPGHGAVGWSILWALARASIRAMLGRSDSTRDLVSKRWPECPVSVNNGLAGSTSF